MCEYSEMIGMNNYQEELKTAWEMFLKHPKSNIPGVRPEILDSWRRSKEFGVNPYHMSKKVLKKYELEKRIEENQVLYDVTASFMEKLYNFDQGSGFLAMLCDSEGYILKMVGDPQALETGKNNLLMEGAARGEQHIGTNAIGTCLYLQKPLQINVNEHYYKPHTSWSCVSAPIFDPNQKMIGVLCFSAYWDRVNYHTLGLAVATADAISKQIALQSSLNKLTIFNEKLDRLIELMSYGVVFANTNGTITQINSLAILFLGQTDKKKEDIIGTNLYNYLPKEKVSLDEAVRVAHMDDFSLDSFNGTFHCSMMVLPSTSENHTPDEVVITLQKTEDVHKMVNRIVGSSAHFSTEDIIGESPEMKEAKRLVKIAAPYYSNVLITGESGTGKELFAQSIHNASPRANAPFVAINCGALPRSLIESELFGYEGGSFTGAKKDGQAGKFELANGGTIFLDEIGDMPYDVQVNLLRVLQSREVTRIGGSKSIPIDVRVISATNQDLLKGIENNTFRQDLYYRLNVFDINIPPLRKRRDDIRPLLDYMLIKYAPLLRKSISGFTDEAYELLENYDWPGNVRELENSVERAAMVAQGSKITVANLPDFLNEKQPEPSITTTTQQIIQPVTVAEEELIRTTLDYHQGNVRRTSDELGLSRGTLYRKIKVYEIDLQKYRE